MTTMLLNPIYFILQEALCAKSMNFSHVMDLVTKVTNLIRGGNRSLNHRKFVAFLDEVSAAYGDLQMHTEIRWISHGKCLERFFALRCAPKSLCFLRRAFDVTPVRTAVNSGTWIFSVTWPSLQTSHLISIA